MNHPVFIMFKLQIRPFASSVLARSTRGARSRMVDFNIRLSVAATRGSELRLQKRSSKSFDKTHSLTRQAPSNPSTTVRDTTNRVIRARSNAHESCSLETLIGTDALPLLVQLLRSVMRGSTVSTNTLSTTSRSAVVALALALLVTELTSSLTLHKADRWSSPLAGHNEIGRGR